MIKLLLFLVRVLIGEQAMSVSLELKSEIEQRVVEQVTSRVVPIKHLIRVSD